MFSTMQFSLIVAFIAVILCIKYAKSEVENDDYNYEALQNRYKDYGKSWMFFPDGDGNPIMAILEPDSSLDDSFEIEPRSKPGPPAVFNLYTRKNINDSFILNINDVQQFKSSPFDVNKKTKFIIHGWMSSGKSDTCQLVKNAYLERHDFNVIIVDWERMASSKTYFRSSGRTTHLGKYVAEMIDFLYDQGVNLEDIHLIGHSLGAHVSGNAGSYVSKGKVGRITGLDPALPGFTFTSSDEKRLDQSDAKFVDVIHTCAGVLGYLDNIGHVDFYPNGGTPTQPGCCCIAEIIEACSHSRSWRYFLESILNPLSFKSVQCDSWKQFKGNNCTDQHALMGDPAPHSLRGNYYLVTQKDTPFARGSRGLFWGQKH